MGFVALAALAVLVAVAWYSDRDEAGSGQPASAAAPVAGETPKELGVALPGTRVTEALPEVSRKGGTITAVLEEVALTPSARLLAERFQCVCGCGDILATCTCTQTPGSRDMKKFLQQLVDEKKTPSEVESAMVARYGPTVIP